MFDLSFAVNSLAFSTLSVTRFAGSYDSSGVWSQSSSSTIAGQASVQPLNGEDLKRVPESYRTESMVKLWFNQELETAGEGTATPGDRFAWQSDIYEVQGKADWSSIGNYFEYYARKVIA